MYSVCSLNPELLLRYLILVDIGREYLMSFYLKVRLLVLVLSYGALFRNKGFLVKLKTERNDSKFAMFMEKENPRSFFRFSFRATFTFPL